MSRCRRTDALLGAAFTGAGLTHAEASHAATCGTCARTLAAARRFDVELRRSAGLIVGDAESDLVIRRGAPIDSGGVSMRRLVAVVALVAIALIAIAGYEGGRWIGSFVEIGFDPEASLVPDGDPVAEPAEAARREIMIREEEVRRAAEEARRRAMERVIVEGTPVELDAWLQEVGDRCRDWQEMNGDDQARTAELLTADVADAVRVAQRLPADAGHHQIVAGAAASIDKTCQGSPPERELIEVTFVLYGP